MIEWCTEKWLFNQLSSEQTIYWQILHTVLYISDVRLKDKIEVDHSWEWKGKGCEDTSELNQLPWPQAFICDRYICNYVTYLCRYSRNHEEMFYQIPKCHPNGLTHMEYASVLKRDQKLFHVFDLASQTNYREIQCKSKACLITFANLWHLRSIVDSESPTSLRKKTISTQNAIIDFKVLISIQMLLNGFMRTHNCEDQRWQSLPYYLMKRFWTGCAINSCSTFYPQMLTWSNVNLIKNIQTIVMLTKAPIKCWNATIKFPVWNSITN